MLTRFSVSRDVIYIDSYGRVVAHRRELKLVIRETRILGLPTSFRDKRQRWNELMLKMKPKLNLI